jgi:hypothetical protein
MTAPILTPALALVCWTLVMWFWLYATRIPAMRAVGLDRFKEKKDLDVLPRTVRQVADNYNHLHEQPVLFYALVFYCHLAGMGDGTNVTLAWIYVAFRVAHSLFQALVNFIPVRFTLFALGSFALMGIAVRCVIATLG